MRIKTRKSESIENIPRVSCSSQSFSSCFFVVWMFTRLFLNSVYTEYSNMLIKNSSIKSTLNNYVIMS